MRGRLEYWRSSVWSSDWRRPPAGCGSTSRRWAHRPVARPRAGVLAILGVVVGLAASTRVLRLDFTALASSRRRPPRSGGTLDVVHGSPRQRAEREADAASDRRT